MFNCEDCANKNGCEAKSLATAMQIDVKSLENKYKGFYGRISIECDYLVPKQGQERNQKGRKNE